MPGAFFSMLPQFARADKRPRANVGITDFYVEFATNRVHLRSRLPVGGLMETPMSIAFHILLRAAPIAVQAKP